MIVQKIELFKDVNKSWRFRIIARNGRILASSEAYSRRGKCVKTASKLAIQLGVALTVSGKPFVIVRRSWLRWFRKGENNVPDKC